MPKKNWFVLVLAVSIQAAVAQDYPVKPVHLMVPYPAGGPVDAIARILAPQLALGQNVIVDNRSGAGGSIGADVVARAEPDGYMLLIGNSGPMTINPVLRKDLGYDTQKNFEPVVWLSSAQMVLIVHPSLPVRSVPDLVALARAQPGSLNYGSAGIGNLTHLGMELFQSMAKVNLVHVPYKGVAPAFIDLMSGKVVVMFGNISGPLQYIRAGRLRALAVTSSKRSPVLPDLPPIADYYPSFDLVTWMGIFVPAGTPEPIRARLQSEFQKVLREPEVRERLVALGNEVVARGGADLSAMIDRELKLYAGIVKTAGIQPQ